MSRSSNSLRASDVITTPIKLKYTASYDCSSLETYGLTVLTGINGAVTSTGSIPQTTLNYLSIRQLYYANFLTGSYLTTSSSFDNSMQSTAASGTLDADVRYFPTESGAIIRVLSVPRNVYGERLSRRSFVMSSVDYKLVDDGNGNIVDQDSNNVHVGNIIYPQGMVIITNPDYLEVLPYYPIAVDDVASFQSSTSPKTVNVISNDNGGSGTLQGSTVSIFGGDVSYFTNNLNGTITLNTTTPGIYTTYYVVDSLVAGGCYLTSNTASVTVSVSADPTTTTTSTTTTTTTAAPTTTTTTTVAPTTTTTSTSTTTTTVPTTTTTTTVPTTTTTSTSTTTTTVPTTTTTSTSTTTTTVPTTTTTTTTTSTTTTTTTSNQVRIDWNLSEEGSGAVRLVIRNSLNVIVLDEESVGGVPSTGGTIYLSESETPYSITVSVAAGTEVAQYRICNNTDSTEIVLNTNVPISSTYTVSPTPTWSTIYATYGNTNTPINCPV